MLNFTNPVHPEGRQPTMQSPAMSLAESVVNVVAGYMIAVVIQLLIFPVFSIRVSFADSMIIGLIFTAVSVVRSYLLRHLFERIRLDSLQQETAALWRAAASCGVWVGQLPMR